MVKAYWALFILLELISQPIISGQFAARYVVSSPEGGLQRPSRTLCWLASKVMILKSVRGLWDGKAALVVILVSVQRAQALQTTRQ